MTPNFTYFRDSRIYINILFSVLNVTLTGYVQNTEHFQEFWQINEDVCFNNTYSIVQALKFNY